jgi:hypothetical protein
MGRVVATLAVTLVLAALPTAARGQVDYRNLDDGRPVRTEDAFVVDHYEFEILAPFTYDADVDGTRRYIVQPELEYGLWPNTQLSVKVPSASSTVREAMPAWAACRYRRSTISMPRGRHSQPSRRVATCSCPAAPVG